MLAIIPVSSRTVAMLPQMVLLFEKLGPQRNHKLVVISCPATLQQAQEFAEGVKTLFGSVTPIATSFPVTETVESRNRMFREALEHLDSVGNTDPIVWMEHALPCARGWMTTLQKEWDSMPREKSFLGCLEDTFFRARDPRTQQFYDPPKYEKKERHMRFGVYPATFLRRSKLIGSATAIPFEVHCRNEVGPNCHQSEEMITVWASRNFDRNESKNVVGEQTAGVESGIRARLNKPFDDGKYCVIHGCRDASLGFLLLKKNYPLEKEVKDAAVASQKNQKNKALRDLDEVTAENEALKARIAALEASSTKEAKPKVVREPAPKKPAARKKQVLRR